VGEGLDPPILALGDLAAHLLDHALVLGGELLDLLRGQILPRQEDVFVQWHGMPFRCAWPAPALSPSCLSERRESSEGGNTGRRADWPCRLPSGMRPSVQLPAGVERKPAL